MGARERRVGVIIAAQERRLERATTRQDESGARSDMDRTAMIERYRAGGDDVENAIAGVTDAELDRRPPSGAWTAREIVHHLADSETMAAPMSMPTRSGELGAARTER